MNVEFKHKKILEKLYSPNDVEVLDAIRDLRNTGDKSIVTYIVELYFTTKSDRIRDKVENFLKDIKDKNAAAPLAMAVNNERYSPILDNLLAICWQTGLDFSAHAHIFTKAAVRASYQGTIEAFTVLEETVPQLNAEQKKQETAYLKDHLQEQTPEKSILMRELIKLFQE